MIKVVSRMLRRLSGRPFQPVLLYHSVDANPPLKLSDGLHNITPDIFEQHLEWLQQHYRVVPLDEFSIAKNREGLATISFDDAYRSVFEQAWPILRSRRLPATIFVNGATLLGKPFWRDRVRLVINSGLSEEFELFASELSRPPGLSLYRYSKHPSNNSSRVAELLNEFLSDRISVSQSLPPMIATPDELIRDDLLTYGNHSQHHFVLSSLPIDQQRNEIAACSAVLQSIPGIRLSGVFSIPFGADRDFNDDTLKAIQAEGYHTVALSRQRLNWSLRRYGALNVVDRIMPQADPLPEQISKIS